jgi:hypothetical protein
MSPEELAVIRAIGTDTAFPWILMGRDLFTLPGSLSSGAFTTFFVNNVANSLYVRLAWLSVLPERFNHLSLAERLDMFEDNVTFYALGDDNMMSVSDFAVEFFNFVTLQAYFASIGIKYTAADKSDDVYGTLPISSATIGKRRFRYDPEFNFTFCPIDKSSIGKILCVVMDTGPLTATEKLRECLGAVVPEFVQYGRSEYNLNVDRLKRVLNEVGMTYHFPSFDTLAHQQVSQGLTPWDADSPEQPVVDDLTAL